MPMKGAIQAAHPVNEDIALQQGGRSRRTVGNPFQGQRNQRYDDQGIKNRQC